MASAGQNLNASQFYMTLRDDLGYLDEKHTIFGEVAEGLETPSRINEAYVDEKGRPYKNIRIKHTYILEDPFDDPPQLAELVPDASPEGKPKDEVDDEVRLEDDWVPMDEQLAPGELEEVIRTKEALSRAVVLENIGDIPDAEIKPPENVSFVCKINPVTEDEDLHTIFSRLGTVTSADIIRDFKTGDSLCYAFIDETPQHLGPNQMGCGFVGAMFQRKGFVRPRSASTPPLPAIKDSSSARHSSSRSSSVVRHSRDRIKMKRRRASSGDSSYLDSSIISAKPPPPPKHTKSPSEKPSFVVSLRQSDAAPKKSSDLSAKFSNCDQVPNAGYAKWLKKQPTFTESELSMRIAVRQKSTASGILYRASSNNGMLPGHLGNLKQGASTMGKIKTTMNNHVTTLGKGSSSVNTPMLMGNIVKKPTGKTKVEHRLDSDMLKSMGNENYKEGRYEDAIVLYAQAIAQDPSKASYYSNKSAALIGLGRLIEAVFDCRVAIRINPMYQRAHQRLAKLYLRLGEADKALGHYKQLGAKADAREVSLAEALKMHLNKSNEARTLRDWETVEEESHMAISSGADSSPQIYALKAEALLNLGKHQEAYSIIQKGPNYDTNLCIQFFGAAGCSDLLTTKAQVYMAAGRFEEAVAAAQCAAKLDPTEEAKATAERALALASARSEGNQLFRASKFTDALKVYTEGLQHQALNSVLLCNRAACLLKLGDYEKSVEDCTAALALRPSYAKARLRRADCFSKLERWDASVQDYEILMKENPKDKDVEKALYVAQAHAQKQLSEDMRNMKNNASSNLVMISSKEHFRRFVIAPWMSVVLFCNKSSHVRLFQLMEQVCLRFPSVNFLKVEIEDNPYIMQLEDVNSVPAFKIYKNGSTIKEISGENFESLESSVKMISCTPYN